MFAKLDDMVKDINLPTWLYEDSGDYIVDCEIILVACSAVIIGRRFGRK